MVSRKSFIITALIINLTICLTLCIVIFTDRNRNDGIKNDSDKDRVSQIENSGNIVMEHDETTLSEPVDTIEGNSSSEQGAYHDNENGEETTEKIIESQVAPDTQPITYKNVDKNGQTTVPTLSGETTPIETTSFIGTMAVINNSCNIRSSADVGGNVVGTANAGASYRIESSKCNSSWVAIYLDDSTLGYISTSFCSIS